MADPTADGRTAPWLAAGLKQGREEAFAAIYDDFGPRLFRAAIGLCGSREDAEDAVHDTFVGLWKTRSDWGRIQDMSAYLFGSLRHVAARQRARRARAAELASAAGQATGTASGTAAEFDRREELERALRLLPTEQREVIALKIHGGLTFAETAAVLAISANTAASRYRYGLEKLRAALGGQLHSSDANKATR
ncbi:MAG: RNA polymerase sigma factor [Pirellulales bacterium]